MFVDLMRVLWWSHWPLGCCEKPALILEWSVALSTWLDSCSLAAAVSHFDLPDFTARTNELWSVQTCWAVNHPDVTWAVFLIVVAVLKRMVPGFRLGLSVWIFNCYVALYSILGLGSMSFFDLCILLTVLPFMKALWLVCCCLSCFIPPNSFSLPSFPVALCVLSCCFFLCLCCLFPSVSWMVAPWDHCCPLVGRTDYRWEVTCRNSEGCARIETSDLDLEDHSDEEMVPTFVGTVNAVDEIHPW